MIGAQLPSLPCALDGSHARLNFCLPRANLRRPLVKVRTSPAISLSPGGRALFLRCDVPPRSQLSRRVRAGLSIRVLRRAEFGDHAMQDGSDAFHSNNYGASNGREAGKNTQGVGNVCRSFGN